MGIFKTLDESSSSIKDIAEKYVQASQKYLKLKIFQQLTLSLSLIIKFFAIGSFIFMAFLFIAIAAAIALGNAFGSITIGCLIVGLFFITFALVVYLCRKSIERKIIKTISNKFFE